MQGTDPLSICSRGTHPALRRLSLNLVGRLKGCLLSRKPAPAEFHEGGLEEDCDQVAKGHIEGSCLDPKAPGNLKRNRWNYALDLGFHLDPA